MSNHIHERKLSTIAVRHPGAVHGSAIVQNNSTVEVLIPKETIKFVSQTFEIPNFEKGKNHVEIPGKGVGTRY